MAEESSLCLHIERQIQTPIRNGVRRHYSVFALAPQPLLIKLGTLLNDLYSVRVFQKHREPDTWRWQNSDDYPRFKLLQPDNLEGVPVLVVGLSATINSDRIKAVLGNKTCIWHLSVEEPGNDFLKSEQMLSHFRSSVRDAFDKIKSQHGCKELHIFPAMPVSAAIICIASLFSVDLAYAYHPVSPYAYCLNNPVKFVDPNGMDVWEINQRGEIVNRIKDKTQDAFLPVQQVDGQWQRMEGQSITFEYGTVISQNTYTYSPDGETVGAYDVYKVRGDGNGTALFEFMGNNVTGTSQVEVGQIMTGVEGDKGLNFITTSHTERTEQGMGNLIMGQVGYGYTVREINHTHPNNPYPSGMSNKTGDIGSASILTNAYRTAGQNVPNFNIYYVPTGQKIPYGPYSQPSHFNRYRR